MQSLAMEGDSSGQENTCCGRSGKIVALYRKPLTSGNVFFFSLSLFFLVSAKGLGFSVVSDQESTIALTAWQGKKSWFLSSSPKLCLIRSYDIRLSVMVSTCFYSLPFWQMSKFFPAGILPLSSLVTVASNSIKKKACNK